MLEIEVKQTKKKLPGVAPFDSEYLIVNGIIDKESWYNSKRYPTAHLYNSEAIDVLTHHTFYDVGKYLSLFSFEREVDCWESGITVEVFCNEYHAVRVPNITIELRISFEDWAKPWSVSRFAMQFEQEVTKLGNSRVKYWQEDDETLLNGFGIEYLLDGDSSMIEIEIENTLKILEDILDKTHKSLMEAIESGSVLTYFKFPDEIKPACKQYLIYFTQFLADMGIAAEGELTEELHHTLFRVIPKNKTESLERIKEALDVYLTAPTANDFEVELSKQKDIAAKQWAANYFHFQSQLSLASSIIQAKDATIETLRLSNYQYKQLLESYKANPKEEEVIKGVFSVKKFEGKGFSVDFAELFRRLKRMIKSGQ